MKKVVIDWELDEEEEQIIKDYITLSLGKGVSAFLYYMSVAREEVAKHHEKSLKDE